jgi:hypothetical protein
MGTMRIVFGVAVTCLLPFRLPAQDRVAQPGAQRFADSLAWQPLLAHVVARLSQHIVVAAFDTTRRPWRMRFPDAAPHWVPFESHLRSTLRARPLAPKDSLFSELEVRPLRISGDTAFVRFTVSLLRRCAEGGEGLVWSNHESAYVLSPGVDYWVEPRGGATGVADGRGCPRRTR